MGLFGKGKKVSKNELLERVVELEQQLSESNKAREGLEEQLTTSNRKVTTANDEIERLKRMYEDTHGQDTASYAAVPNGPNKNTLTTTKFPAINDEMAEVLRKLGDGLQRAESRIKEYKKVLDGDKTLIEEYQRILNTNETLIADLREEMRVLHAERGYEELTITHFG